MSRKYRPLLLSALVLAAACAVDNPTGPPLTTSVRTVKSTSPAAARPAGGTCSTSFSLQLLEPPFATLDISGVCNLKHLGRTTMHATQVLDMSTGALINSTTYTAANGDQLVTTFAGTSSPPPNVVFEGTETYVGGTGRFAGASGSSHLSGSATVNLADFSGTGAYTASGSISY